MTVLTAVLLGVGGLLVLLLIAALIRIYFCSRCPECHRVPGEAYASMALMPIGAFFMLLYLPLIGALLPLLLILFKPAELLEMAGVCRDCVEHGAAA